MTNEEIINVLFYLLRRKDDSCPRAYLEHLSGVDWDELFGASLRLGVAPLLYDRIKRKSFVEEIPVETIDELKRVYHNNAAQNMLVRKQLEETLIVLEAQQVPVMLLKGGALAFTVY